MSREELDTSVESIKIQAELVNNNVSHVRKLLKAEHYEAANMVSESLETHQEALHALLQTHFDQIKKYSASKPREDALRAKSKVTRASAKK